MVVSMPHIRLMKLWVMGGIKQWAELDVVGMTH